MASCWLYFVCAVFGVVVGASVYDTEEDLPPLEVYVFSYNVIVRWAREGAWDNITEFDVSLASDSGEYEPCEEPISCEALECEFNSNVCDKPLNPCSNATISVTGNNETSLSEIMTAPAPKDKVGTKIIDSTLFVLWAESSSSDTLCLNYTEVSAVFPNSGTITEKIPSGVDRVLFPLSQCDLGAGEVRVTSFGGSGMSEPERANFTFEDTGFVTPLVGFLELNVTCGILEVTWELIDTCPYLAWYRVTLMPAQSTVITIDYNDTSAFFEGLEPGSYYEVCVQPVDASSNNLAKGICSNMTTPEPAVEDLIVEPVNHETIQASWSPNECNMSQPLLYDVEITTCLNFTNETCTGKTFVNSTTELNYTRTGLEPYTLYHVCVITINTDDTLYQACEYVTTLPKAPYDLQAYSEDASTIRITWNYLDNLAQMAMYDVSWKSDDEIVFSDNTTLQEYVIESYNGTGSIHVCVTVTLDETESIPECNEFQLLYLEDDFGLILGLILGIPLILLAIGLVLAFVFKVNVRDVFPGM
ncbi:collagen alpha-1(XIV) chain-like isoform X2 [Penaeus japonicus]|uniref:collagen alpha-1(XIV) chain-like isoform X2 n=1 Tax=Penaeus japonicus TaxID=27405 RepID=UPI001C70C409|nr:collagen alpha-1(XIV) chain-like isoform X2 [Penaeus japonicus]